MDVVGPLIVLGTIIALVAFSMSSRMRDDRDGRPAEATSGHRVNRATWAAIPISIFSGRPAPSRRTTV